MIYVTICRRYVTITVQNYKALFVQRWRGNHLKLYIKYMVSNRCKMAVKEILKKLGLHFVVVDLGEIDIMENISGERLENFRLALSDGGFELMDDTRAILIERIINVIIQMVHHTEEMIKINFSEFLSEKLNHDYNYMSKIFSEVKGITIQQFIIIHKIEKIKELLLYGELNLTEISYRLNYSSVSHLSNQFRKVTGLSPSDFKHLKDRKRSSIEEIGLSNIIN
jgi:AraC-like DNA-binding protein